MKTVYSERHRLRDAKTELYGGELVQPFERPSRAAIIIKALVESGLGKISDPDLFSLDPVLAVHDANFVAFLETAWQDWQEKGYNGEVIANVWPARPMQSRIPATSKARWVTTLLQQRLQSLRGPGVRRWLLKMLR